jgi:hypothetical protein
VGFGLGLRRCVRVSIIFLIIQNIAPAAFASDDCARRVSALAGGVLLALHDLSPGNHSKEISNLVESLLNEPGELPHSGRLEALSRAFVYFSLYLENSDLLLKVFKANLAEEERLIAQARVEKDVFKKRVLVDALREYNRVLYSILSHEDAEYFLAMASIRGQDPVSSQNLGRWLERQYERVFISAFPIAASRVTELDPAAWEGRPKLISDLHSMDQDLSLRARYFLSLSQKWFSESAGLKPSSSTNPHLDFLMDLERERPNSKDLVGFERSSMPIGRLRGKEVNYRSLDDQESADIRMMANSFETYQIDPHDRRSQETVMKLILESMMPAQIFQVIPDGEVTAGLTLYQLCQLSSLRSMKALSKNIAAVHPWYHR